MKFKILIFISFIISLLSCSNGKSNWMNTNIDGNLLAEKPSFKDDFYQAVNYDDLKNLPLGEVLPFSGDREDYYKTISDQISSMVADSDKGVKNPEKIEKQKFVQLYKKSLDWEKRNREGLNPIIPVFNKIQKIKSVSELNNLLQNDEDFRLFFPVQVSLRNNNNLFYTPGIYLTLMFDRYPQEYSDFYESMLVRMGLDNSDAKRLIQSAYEFEKNYNFALYEEKSRKGKLASWNNLDKEIKNFPVRIFLESCGVPLLQYGICPEALVFDSLYLEENLEAIKTLCVCRLIQFSSNLLDMESFNSLKQLNEKLNGKELTYTDEQISFKILNDSVPLFLGKIWCEECCSKELFKDVENLSYTILEKYKEISYSWNWLNIGTRYNLSQMLGNTKIIVGNSSSFDYSELNLADSFFDSIMNVLRYETKIQAKQCYSDLDRYAWGFSPQTYNAFYNATNNSVNICAGYIYGTNYDEKLSVEKKYATLGFVISHEISHLFSMKNPDGNIYQLFNSKDHAELERRINSMADSFSSFTVYEDLKCRGDYCKAEIGADTFGLAIILEIVKDIKDFDYKAFFEFYAKQWFLKETKEIFLKYYETDTHPPCYLRTNAIVQQFDEFYKVFDIKPGDGMYLASKKRFRF